MGIMSKYIMVDGSRIKNLEGSKFEKLTVKKYAGKSNRYAIWECLCECGTVVNVSSKDLTGSRKRDCGCSRDLTAKHQGERYGKLTIVKFIRYQEQNQIYLCKCDCGKQTEVSYGNLLSQNTKSCGCIKENYYLDVTGTVYGFLTALESVGKCNHGYVWRCKCRCGNEINVPLYRLQDGDVRTCGCFFDIEKEKRSKVTVIDKRLQDLQNGSLDVKGVSLVKGKWQARISFCKKNYFLGRYINKEDAIQARISAETHLYTDFLEWYENEYSKK